MASWVRVSAVFPFRFQSTLNTMNGYMNEQMDILVSGWVEGPQSFSLKDWFGENITNYSLSQSYFLSYSKADIGLGSSTINYERFSDKDLWSMFTLQLNHHSSQISFKIFCLNRCIDKDSKDIDTRGGNFVQNK